MTVNKYILETRDLCKKYGKSQVLNNMNMKIPRGSIYGFIGKNGAGKTTLIRLICGLQYQNDGDIIINGISNTDPNINNIRKKFGAIVESPALHLNLTAKENIELQLDILGVKDSKKVDELLQFVGLNDTGKKIANNFSLGMKQRLAIAIALCGEPEFLILDEPVNGLDPQGIIDMRELLRKVNKEKNITILISSHILDELAKIATYYGFISGGKIIAEMSADEMNSIRKKNMCLTVNKIDGIKEAMSVFENEYEIVDDNNVVVNGNISVTAIILSLHKYNIEVSNIVSKEESLEEYFFELLGGTDNV